MMPRMPTRRIAMSALVLVLATACSKGSGAAAPTASPSTAPPSATASATASTKPKPKPTATATTPAPKPTATKPAIPPATGPAPAHFSPIDFSFVGAHVGWALGQVCTDSSCTARMARTTDSGHSWHASPAPNGLHTNEDEGDAVREVRFGNQDHGWLFGPSLYATHNGGTTWKKLDMDGDVLALEEWQHTTWVLVSSCEAGGCRVSLWVAPMGSDAFTLRALVPAGNALDKRFQLVRAGTVSGWVSAWGDGESLILRTRNDGRTWTQITDPCKSQMVFGKRLTRIDAQNLWIACGFDSAAGSQGKTVYHSNDGGTHWGSKNDAPMRGQFADLVALGTQTALLSTSHSGLLRTTDGGISWREVAPDCCDAGFGKIETIDYTNAWAIGFGANAIFFTSDRGAHWGRFTFHA
jgi:photosystem II stability/assembly factor-like uncharacterized protein